MSEETKTEETGAPSTEVKQFSKAEMEAFVEEQTAGLKSKIDELLGEKKSSQKKQREAEEQARIEREAKAKQENDYESLFKSSQEKTEEWKSKFDELQGSVRKEKRQNAAMKLASELADGANAELLSTFIAQRIDIDEGGKQVILSAEGSPTVSTLDDLKKEIRSSGKYDSLLSGSKASGASVNKSPAGRASGGADLTKMTKEQKLEYFKSKRGE